MALAVLIFSEGFGLICFMYVFLSVCLLQVRFVYPCVTSYHFYAPTKATRILGRPTTSPIQMASLINALVLQIIRCLLNLSLKPADSKLLLCQRKAVVSYNYRIPEVPKGKYLIYIHIHVLDIIGSIYFNTNI